MSQIIPTNFEISDIENSQQIGSTIYESAIETYYFKCPICLEENIQNFIKLNCNHIICKDCFQIWHINNNKDICSICRTPIISLKKPPINYYDKILNTIFFSGISISFCSFIFYILHIYSVI